MSSQEFAEWLAYYELEPWGAEYDALERAQIAAILANAYRDPKTRREAYRPADLMVRFTDGRGDTINRVPTADDLLAKVKMINKLVGGKDLTDETR